MTSLLIIAAITFLFLLLFQKNLAEAKKADELNGFYGSPMYYPTQKASAKKAEKTEPFVGAAYAIFFVLAIFAFIQMQDRQEKPPRDYEEYQTSEDYEQEDTNVVVIRP